MSFRSIPFVPGLLSVKPCCADRLKDQTGGEVFHPCGRKERTDTQETELIARLEKKKSSPDPKIKICVKTHRGAIPATTRGKSQRLRSKSGPNHADVRIVGVYC